MKPHSPKTSPADSELCAAIIKRRRTVLVRAVRQSLQAAAIREQNIVVACSGGPDSLALLLSLFALREALGLSLSVVTIDHRLRRESAIEAAAVCDLAQRLGLYAEAIAVTVPAGPSRMALARTARYVALARFARQTNAALIAIGHNRDDQSETMLMRWLGGAGLGGLSGMAPIAAFPFSDADVFCESTDGRPIALVRPLLTQSRAAIEAFLAPIVPLLSRSGPLPAQDPSNQDDHYLRSRLRHSALPILRELAPHLDAHLLALSSQLRADADHLDREAARALDELAVVRLQGAIALPLTRLTTLPQALASRVLRRAAKLYLGVDLGQRHIEALLRLLHSGAALDLASGLRAERRYDALYLLKESSSSGET